MYILLYILYVYTTYVYTNLYYQLHIDFISFYVFTNICSFAVINITFLKLFIYIENLKIIKLIILYNIYILVFKILRYKHKLLF